MNRRDFLVQTAAVPAACLIPVVADPIDLQILPPDETRLQVGFLDLSGRLLVGNGYRTEIITFVPITTYAWSNARPFACTPAVGTPLPSGIGVWDLAGSPVSAWPVRGSATWPRTAREGDRVELDAMAIVIVFPPSIPPALDDGEPS